MYTAFSIQLSSIILSVFLLYTTIEVSAQTQLSVAVNAFDNACGKVYVASSNGFVVGDRVCIYQSQGATVVSPENSQFGAIENIRTAGNFAFSNILSINGTEISLSTTLDREFDAVYGKVQLIKVITGENISINEPIVAQPWNGTNGGIIVIEAKETLTISSIISVAGKGFRGGKQHIGKFIPEAQIAYGFIGDFGAAKGEGIAVQDSLKKNGRGAWANGGGGGNQHNAGGGGGANASRGGFGGFNWAGQGTQNDKTRGIGGYSLTYSSGTPRLFMGGAGGAGHKNADDYWVSNGANGGGAVVLIAKKIVSVNGQIDAKGSNGELAGADGAGGAGAGGSVLLSSDEIVGALTINISGGNGGNARINHAPGGGGGGGAVLVTNTSLVSSLDVLKNGGQSGCQIDSTNQPISPRSTFGSTSGQDGIILGPITMPRTGFTRLQSVSIVTKDSVKTCANAPVSISVNTLGGIGKISFRWVPTLGVSDSTSATPSITVSKNSRFTVYATDESGCSASSTVDIIINNRMEMEITGLRQICEGSEVTLNAVQLGGTTNSTITWTNASDTSFKSESQRLIVRPTSTTKYYVSIVDNTYGCSALDSVTVTVSKKQTPTISGSVVVCKNIPQVYTLTNVEGGKFLWSPSNADSIQVSASTHSAKIWWSKSGTANVMVTPRNNDTLCYNAQSIAVVVDQSVQPTIVLASSTALCGGDSLMLDAGAEYPEYRWSNGARSRRITVSNAGSYSVTVRTNNGCEAISNTVSVTVAPKPVVTVTTKEFSSECALDSVMIDAGDHASYLWSNGERTRSIVVTSSGTYSVVVANQAGCTVSSAPVKVTIGSKTAHSIFGKSDVCPNSAEVYHARTSNGSRNVWNVQGATDIRLMGTNNDSILVNWGTVQGRIVVEEIVPSQCKRRGTMAVTVRSIERVTITSTDDQVDDISPVILDAGSGFVAYRWSNGANTRTITVTDSGSYSVAVVNNAGCTITALPKILARKLAIPTILSTDSVLCPNSSVILKTSVRTGSILWNTGETTNTITVTTAGDYSYTVTYNDNRTVVSATFTIRNDNGTTPLISRENNQLLSTSGTNYQWFHNDIAIPGATSKVLRIHHSGLYSVEVINGNNFCPRRSSAFTVVDAPTIIISGSDVRTIVGDSIDVPFDISAQNMLTDSLTVTFTLTTNAQSVLSSQTPTYHINGGVVQVDTMTVVLSAENASKSIAKTFLALATREKISSVIVSNITVSTVNSINVVKNGTVTIEKVCSSKTPIVIGSAEEIISVYPQPAATHATFAVTTIQNARTTLSVITVSGIEILRKDLSVTGKQELTLDTTMYPNGMYFAQFTTGSSVMTTSFIVQK